MSDYQTIAADPPWDEPGGCGRGTGGKYPTMSRADILRAMVSAPCWRPASPSHLWLWTTTTSLLDGLWLLDALGYRYVTMAIWAKTTKQGRLAIGMGQYLRHSFEPLLFGVRGPKARALSPAGTSQRDIVETITEAQRGRHSEKPAEVYRVIESVSLGAPRLEMFARAERAGWDVWGNEVSEECGHRAEPC